VLDKAEYSAFESTLNSPIVSYRKYSEIVLHRKHIQVKELTDTTVRSGTLSGLYHLLEVSASQAQTKQESCAITKMTARYALYKWFE